MRTRRPLPARGFGLMIAFDEGTSALHQWPTHSGLERADLRLGVPHARQRRRESSIKSSSNRIGAHEKRAGVAPGPSFFSAAEALAAVAHEPQQEQEHVDEVEIQLK